MKKLINKILHLFEMMRVRPKDKSVFLTFDDGPERGVTEFVLSELSKYDAKATFFCRGDNVIKNRALFDEIINEGHSIGNHTFSHINGFKTKMADYLEDIEKANDVLHTVLFRPPWGSLTFIEFLKIRRRYKIVYWSLVSGDTAGENFSLTYHLERLQRNTKSGDIVLFHCSQKHEKATKQILPVYLEWLSTNGFIMRGL